MRQSGRRNEGDAQVCEDRFASKSVFEVTIGKEKYEGQGIKENYLRIGVKNFQPLGVNMSYVFKCQGPNLYV